MNIKKDKKLLCLPNIVKNKSKLGINFNSSEKLNGTSISNHTLKYQVIHKTGRISIDI